MLILTRKPGESIVVGNNDVKIVLLGVSGNQVRLGFDADPNIRIDREEIYHRIKREQLQRIGQAELYVEKE